MERVDEDEDDNGDALEDEDDENKDALEDEDDDEDALGSASLALQETTRVSLGETTWRHTRGTA